VHSVLRPIGRALTQLDDPVFAGVALRSLAWSLLCFVLLAVACVWGLHGLVAHGWWGWLAGLAGGIGAALLAMFLFVPVAVVIATLYIERVAAAVDRAWYPHLPVPRGAPLAAQAWDGVALGLRVLLLTLVGWLLALLLPGIGLLLGWLIGAWAIGRGMFVAVAMRRMTRPQAQELYRAHRLPVLIQGAILALAASIPLLNLLVPVLGAAIMVHLLHLPEMAGTRPGGGRAFEGGGARPGL
jgi:uncharacterized protein involved in cysteine biosynthesis